MFRVVCCTLLMLAVTSPVLAQKEKKKDRELPVVTNTFKVPEGVTLTTDQQAKFDALKAEYTPKVKEAAAKVETVLTAEQRKARRTAGAAARSEGKKGKEVKAAIDAAANLSDEQTKQLAEAEAQLKLLQTEVRDKQLEILTPEQKSVIPAKKGNKKKKA